MARPHAERVIVWAPVGRTVPLITETLERAGLQAARCDDVDAFCRLANAGAGAALLTEEVFTRNGHADRIADVLEKQPPWSDLPVTVFASTHRRLLPRYERLTRLNPRRGVTVLERPIRPAVLISVVEAALRDRRRQYELRDALQALRVTNEALDERVKGKTAHLRRLAGRLTRAEQAERRRISQLLHDDLQQILHSIGLKIRIMVRQLEAGTPAKLQGELEETYEWIDEAYAVTRQLTSSLSPPVLGGPNFADAMEWLGLHMEELHGLDVTVESGGRHQVEDEDARELLFQIVRELLFNVAKHAGTDQATVRLSEETGHLVIHVIDEGEGFDVDEATGRDEHEGGFGLFSAAERLDLMGGRLETQSAPGDGTHIRVHAPAA